MAAFGFGLSLRAFLLIIAISASWSAPQQKQTTQTAAAQVTQKQQKVETAGVTRVQDPKCLQPMEMGPCRMSLARFYYNSQTNTCEPFKFGGCRGNDNKFGFLKTCEDACVLPTKTATNNVANSNAKPAATVTIPKTVANTPISITTTTKAPVVAQTQPRATKPILIKMKFVLVLYFIAGLIATLHAAAVDSETAKPKPADADSTSVAPTEASDVVEECHQPKETGRCFALFYRYAYNVESRQCEEFIYGGCNGNRNNFESKEECEKKCLPVDPAEHKEESKTEKTEESKTVKKASDEASAPVVPPAVVQPAVAA
ncbi:carboxypeptidase inhibitor SmCI-like [Eurosta solidaginis]|uniref:carboxypeptidase inhibitor SmCI-like n=1 Tax=Eurosta solidaginis TaxID=178769 RepID=UPI0035305A06